jgi:PIN domain nuclease of toxin-antitoxin system
MRILLDTHAYFWWETDDPKLSTRASKIIGDTESIVLVSAVTAWELATKARIGKWPQAAEVAADIDTALREEPFEPLPITIAHARLAGFLSGSHADPFDRMLAAQARLEDVPLVTADPVFRTLGVQVLW